jgi:hypothetical protein
MTQSSSSTIYYVIFGGIYMQVSFEQVHRIVERELKALVEGCSGNQQVFGEDPVSSRCGGVPATMGESSLEEFDMPVDIDADRGEEEALIAPEETESLGDTFDVFLDDEQFDQYVEKELNSVNL